MPGCGLEDLSDAFAGLGRAFDVALSADFLGDGESFGARDWALVHACEILDRLWVVAQVFLASDEDDGESLAEVEDL